jgi:hypothetical protein
MLSTLFTHNSDTEIADAFKSLIESGKHTLARIVLPASGWLRDHAQGAKVHNYIKTRVALAAMCLATTLPAAAVPLGLLATYHTSSISFGPVSFVISPRLSKVALLDTVLPSKST